MQFSWTHFPFLRFVIPFCLGIITYLFGKLPFLSSEFLYTLMIIYVALLVLQKRVKSYTLPTAIGFVGVLICFIFGYTLTRNHTPSENEHHLVRLEESYAVEAFRGNVLTAPQETEKSLKVIVEVTSVRKDSVWKPISGKVMCYFPKSAVKVLGSGSVMVVSGLHPILGPKNPGEFDYRHYLENKGIHFQSFIKENQCIALKNVEGERFTTAVLKTSHVLTLVLENRLTAFFTSPREAAIAKALVLGVKDDVDNEIMSAYSGTGAMHVLAVSGLHVGLVYQVFVWLFGWLKSRNITVNRFVQCAILLLTIWSYAFITGLSPSVTRASTMFSFIVLANCFGRRTNVYNTLAVSAFFLLCINPYLITEVGFQLSYLAVLAIVYIYPKIYPKLDISNTILRTLWSWTCVSIAAQIGTCVLGLFYFHQFPTYFFVSNVVVIPGAILILYLGLTTLLFSFFPFVSKILAWVLEHIIWLLNEAIFMLHKLPFSLIKGIHLSLFECALLYGIIFLLLLFLWKRDLRMYMTVVLCTMFFFGMRLQQSLLKTSARKMVFYSVPKQTALGLQYASVMRIFADSVHQNANWIHYRLQPHWEKEGIHKVTFYDILQDTSALYQHYDGNVWLSWKGKTVLLYSKPFRKDLKEKVFVDYLVVRNNVWLDKEKLRSNLNLSTVVVDGSNNWKTRKFCNRAFPNVHDIIEKGALIENI